MRDKVSLSNITSTSILVVSSIKDSESGGRSSAVLLLVVEVNVLTVQVM
jgi:hypothetical protein